MSICNLTPHAIVVRLANGADRTILPSGVIARVVMREAIGESVDGIPTINRISGDIEMPEFTERFALVSSMVLDAARAQNRPLLSWLLAPDTGATAIRDKGQIIAVTRLVRG